MDINTLLLYIGISSINIFILGYRYWCKVETEKIIIKNNIELEKYKIYIENNQEENKLFVSSFYNYQKNKYFEMGLILLKLKLFHEQALSELDEFLDDELYYDIKNNINNIDITLKEISLLTPHIINKINADFSIFEEMFSNMDSKIFKN